MRKAPAEWAAFDEERQAYYAWIDAHVFTDEQIERIIEKFGQLHKIIDGQMDENERLRELVRDMWFWHYCGHIDSVPQEKQMEHIDGIISRMAELGVEVES